MNRKQKTVGNTAEMIRETTETESSAEVFAGMRHPEDRDGHMAHNVSACFTDAETLTGA